MFKTRADKQNKLKSIFFQSEEISYMGGCNICTIRAYDLECPSGAYFSNRCKTLVKHAN